jgi:cobalt/nickel transport system permease protein
MASVIAVQALIFQDGGLVVMGANIFNMGIIGTMGGYAIYRFLARVLGGEERRRIPAAAIAAWLAVMLGAAAMTIQLVLSGTTPAIVAVPAMLGVHAVIGIGEALITAAALAYIAATRPDIFRLRDSSLNARSSLDVQGAPNV